MAKKARKAKTVKKRETRRKGDNVDKKRVMKDLQDVLKDHGIKAKISDMSFKVTAATACTCSHGGPGVLRVVGGKIVCVCDH